MQPMFDQLLRSINIAALAGGVWAMLKIAIPAALAIRDALRDTALALNEIRKDIGDHEERLRWLEGGHEDRRHFERRDLQRRHVPAVGKDDDGGDHRIGRYHHGEGEVE